MTKGDDIVADQNNDKDVLDNIADDTNGNNNIHNDYISDNNTDDIDIIQL